MPYNVFKFNFFTILFPLIPVCMLSPPPGDWVMGDSDVVGGWCLVFSMIVGCVSVDGLWLVAHSWWSVVCGKWLVDSQGFHAMPSPTSVGCT